MKFPILKTTGALAIMLLLAAPAQAQQSGGQHQPGMGQMPEPNQQMGPGMMRGGGMMGPGMMGPGMMGSGMMGPGMNGQGMMGMMSNCPMMATMMGQGMKGQVRFSSYAEGRLAFLNAELSITEKQKAAWDAYAKALRESFERMQSMHEVMEKVWQAKTPVDRLDAHVSAMTTRLEAMKKLQPALSKLYASLSDEQKKKADAIMGGMGCMM